MISYALFSPPYLHPTLSFALFLWPLVIVTGHNIGSMWGTPPTFHHTTHSMNRVLSKLKSASRFWDLAEHEVACLLNSRISILTNRWQLAGVLPPVYSTSTYTRRFGPPWRAN